MPVESQNSRRDSLLEAIKSLVLAIQNDDEQLLDAVLRVSQSRRLFAPLAFTIGAFAMLFQGMRVLLTDWRLMLIQIPPAVWIWLAMLDLKIHVLHDRSLHQFKGPVLIPVGLAIIAITAGCFFLNAVFAFAIIGSGRPDIRAAVQAARGRLGPVLAPGVVVGAMLATASTIAPRWEKPWFSVAMGTVVGIMMLCYVAVPARLIGVKRQASRRDKLTASMISSALGATVCTPPYLIGRIGILMLGSRVLLVPGIFVLTIGFGLQAGATGAVRAVKMSAALAAGVPPQEID